MKQSQTSFVILGILAIHPNQSGYEIRQTIQQSVGFFWGESYGQLYPTLKRLVSEGLIEVSKSSSDQKTTRQEYSLTPAGHAKLQQWLALPYRDDPPRNEFLLKLFFGRDAAPGVSIEHLRKFQQNNRSFFDSLSQLETLARAHNSGNPGFPYWMLTLSYGMSQIRAALEWSESAIDLLSTAEFAPPSQPAFAEDNPAAKP